MTRTFQLSSRLAALISIKEITPGKEPEVDTDAIFYSHETGVVIGHRTPLSQSSLPLKLKAAINKHFGTVFALRHEDWTERRPSPRAVYVDNLQPWTVETDDE